jgi:hypothetical protein
VASTRRTLATSAIATSAIAIAFALAIGASGCSRDEPAALDGSIAAVRLGMAPRDVRARFAPGSAGQWQTKAGVEDDTVLEWTGGPDARIETARFEFHLGMLVAIRESVRKGTGPDDVVATPKTVALRKTSPGDGAGEITVLSRDCPTHHAEAESLARLASGAAK